MALQFPLPSVFILLPLYLLPLASPQPQPDCQSTCGHVNLSSGPFGMNDPNCYRHNDWFQIECRQEKPYLIKFKQLEVIKIDVPSCKVWIKNPIYRFNCINKSTDSERSGIDLGGSPFTYSPDHNVFVGVGCNTQALLQSSNDSDVAGCVSICDKDHEANNVSGIPGCRGKYCCTTSLPLSLTQYKARIEDIGNTSTSDSDCNYALIIAKDQVYNDSRSVSELKGLNSVPAVLKYTTNCNESASGTLNSGQCGPPFPGILVFLQVFTYADTYKKTFIKQHISYVVLSLSRTFILNV